MAFGGQRTVAVVMTLVFSVTTCGLPLHRAAEQNACGCGAGCQCSLESVLSGQCCCAGKSSQSCCSQPEGAAAKSAAGQLAPCCAARLKQQSRLYSASLMQPASATADPLAGSLSSAASVSSTAQHPDLCIHDRCTLAGHSPRTANGMPATVCEHATVDEDAPLAWTCNCGPREQQGWLVLTEPRVTGRDPAWRPPTVRLLRLLVSSDSLAAILSGPEPPPPRANRV